MADGGGGSEAALPAGQASPATRDAIVGMLTMSRAVVEPAPPSKRSRPRSYSSDEETYAATQDDEYGECRVLVRSVAEVVS